MVAALKPRSKPRIGTAKMCTSQQAESSQLTHNKRFSPGTASRSHEPRGAAAGPPDTTTGSRGTHREQPSVSSGNASSSR